MDPLSDDVAAASRAIAVPDGIDMDAEAWAKLGEKAKANRIRKAAWGRFHSENDGSPLHGPYVIDHVLDHEFVEGEKKGCNMRVAGRPGNRCARGKLHPLHHGYPPSYNQMGSGDQLGYQQRKRHWDALFVELLEGCGMPKGIGHLFVEAEIVVPSRVDRDKGNLQFFAEKSLGDALQEGGWLLNDSWRQYDFGRYALGWSPGVSSCRFILLPSWETPGWDRFAVGGQESLL